MSGLFPSIIYLSNKWLWGTGFFALLARASRGRSKLFVSLQLGLQIRMSLPAWRPMQPLFLSTGWLLYIIWKLGPLIPSSCWAMHQTATANGADTCRLGGGKTSLQNAAFRDRFSFLFSSKHKVFLCYFNLHFKKKNMPSSCYLVSDLNCGRCELQFPRAQQGFDLLMDMKVCREKGLILELPCVPKECNYFSSTLMSQSNYSFCIYGRLVAWK